MKPRVDTIILMPIGPGLNLDFIRDSMDSIRRFCKSSWKFLLVDDSKSNAAKHLLHAGEGIVLTTKGVGGVFGGLYVNKCKAFKLALETFDFRVLLSMDTDALMTGPAPDIDAIDYFDKHPSAGILGSYKITCCGRSREFSEEGRLLLSEVRFCIRNLLRETLKAAQNTRGDNISQGVRSVAAVLRNGFKRLGVKRELLALCEAAAPNQYVYGEHVQGGAFFVNPILIRKWNDRGYLTKKALATSRISDDVIFGLLTKAASMELHDFGQPLGPMCVRWKGLPAHPTELIRRRCKIVHSTKDFAGFREAEIRELFRQSRPGASGQTKANLAGDRAMVRN